MKQDLKQTATALTYAGILPFLLLSIAVIIKIPGYDYGLALRGYGLAIVSFLCGVHWAAHLFSADQCRRNLLVTSNIITLIAFASLLPLPQNMAFILQGACLVFLLWIDYGLLKQDIISDWYFGLRRQATAVVVLLLLCAAFLS